MKTATGTKESQQVVNSKWIQKRVHFSHKKQLRSLNLDSSEIPVVDEYKFQGIIFDKKLTFVPHLKYLKTKCNIAQSAGAVEYTNYTSTEGLTSVLDMALNNLRKQYERAIPKY